MREKLEIIAHWIGVYGVKGSSFTIINWLAESIMGF